MADSVVGGEMGAGVGGRAVDQYAWIMLVCVETFKEGSMHVTEGWPSNPAI